MLNPIQNEIIILGHIQNLKKKQFGHQLKRSIIILRQLITEFTLTDNLLNTIISLTKSVCHDNDSVILGKIKLKNQISYKYF